MSSKKNFANREVMDLIIYDYETNKPFLSIDYANTTSHEMTGEDVYAYGGKGHPKRVPFSGEKGGTFTIETQLQSSRLYRLLTGADAEDNIDFVKREKLTTEDGTSLVLTETPIDGTIFVYKADDDCGKEEQISATGKNVTLTNAGTAKDKYIVYYQRNLSNVTALKVTTSTFPQMCKIYADTQNKGEDGKTHNEFVKVYKASPQSQYSVSNANTGDPVTVTITLDMMADDDGNVIDYAFDD